MTDWVRLWHDMPTDPKWRVIARRSGQPLPCVIAVFNLLMVNASSNADERGTLRNWDNEDAAAALDMEPEQVAAIMDAMQGKVLDGDRLSGWEKRQPKREDSGVAARVAKHREAKRDAEKRTVTHGNAPETETETDTDTEIKKEKSKGAGAPDYTFSGSVIRLKRADFDRWQSSYSRLDLMAELQSRDDWLATQPEPERKNWFHSTSRWLSKLHSAADAPKPRVPL